MTWAGSALIEPTLAETCQPEPTHLFSQMDCRTGLLYLSGLSTTYSGKLVTNLQALLLWARLGFELSIA